MTDQSEEWGPWIEHDGSGCPAKGMFVQVIAANGRNEAGVAKCATPSAGHYNLWTWASIPPLFWEHRVIRYRIRKPRALQQLRELLENLPATERERINS